MIFLVTTPLRLSPNSLSYTNEEPPPQSKSATFEMCSIFNSGVLEHSIFNNEVLLEHSTISSGQVPLKRVTWGGRCLRSSAQTQNHLTQITTVRFYVSYCTGKRSVDCAHGLPRSSAQFFDRAADQFANNNSYPNPLHRQSRYRWETTNHFLSILHLNNLISKQERFDIG